jgi:hypothetical protein
MIQVMFRTVVFGWEVMVVGSKGGVCVCVVKVVDFKPLAPHRCGFESQRGLLILSCLGAIRLAYEQWRFRELGKQRF